MLGWLIEIRNFFLAISLAWLGVTFAPATSDTTESVDQPRMSIQDADTITEILP